MRSARESKPAARILRSATTVRIWGLTPEERLRRSFVRAGCEEIEVVAPKQGEVPLASRVVVCRGDLIYDERLITALVEHRGRLLLDPVLGPVAAHVRSRDAETAEAVLAGQLDPDAIPKLRAISPDVLAPAWLPNLRKREPPYVHEARPDRVAEVESRTFAASYKGATDLVTRWVWPRPAAVATRWCARRGVTPNSVTLLSWVLAALAAWLFLRGDFGLGLLAAWSMTFLDTVDGKLARVTLTSSRLGDVLDHGLDLLHPPFWYLAWGAGVGSGAELTTGVVVGGYVLGRLLEGAFLAAFRFETHSWRPVDAAFRTVTARRNPNLILLSLGVLAGRPDAGLAMVALWTVASLAFHVVRLLQAFAARSRGETVVAWESAEEGT